MIYPYLDTSVRRLFKQKYSPADLMHGHISKSEHSAGSAAPAYCYWQVTETETNKKTLAELLTFLTNKRVVSSEEDQNWAC